jgi:hypothetical protein
MMKALWLDVRARGRWQRAAAKCPNPGGPISQADKEDAAGTTFIGVNRSSEGK